MLLLKYCIGRRCQARHDITGVPISTFFDPDALGTEKLQLEPWEYAEHGPFAKLNQWLDDHAARFGFYRCYADSATSGVAIEPWHFSYAPLSQAYPEQIQPQELAQRLTAAQLPGLKLVLSQLESIVANYVLRTTPAPTEALAARTHGDQ